MQREVKLIFFAVGSIGNSSDLVLAKDLENIEEKNKYTKPGNATG